MLKSLIAPDTITGTGNPKFVFRLTCVIEGDKGLAATAHKRIASPTSFVIQRRDDSRDRFKRNVISKYSQYAIKKADKDDLDDSASALSHAESRRRAHEKAVFAGTITIPRITTAYRLGDKISDIYGRRLSLQTNSGVEQGESIAWPCVASITFSFDPQQSTTLHLTDRRSDPARKRTT